ncbi:nucleotide disphospho-sugar-binding domain-containing protein [Larkinella soli]|uniref:nucleotide disphospho-sugar-binding domain-containing protein n=1 Tax=Larkinella soli TaxID=1770527 RepID=UPI000FFBCBFE|nr:nucleotide disphospho-sugar-binding domain-containing protein [Larkinella soli]
MNTKRILFATIPADGHFNPLTGLARHLLDLGHDVRWYTGGKYVSRAEKIGIPVFPFRKAMVVNQENFEELFPERERIRGKIARIRFDISNVFLKRAPEFVEDLTEIRREFPFDLVICDTMFAAGPIIKRLMNIPVVTIGIVPLSETSRDLPPAGMGLEPALSLFGRWKHALMRFMTTQVLFRECTELNNRILRQYGLEPTKDFVFDTFIRQPDLYLQSGVPGFEYPRSDMSPNVRFVGPLMPYSAGSKGSFRDFERLNRYERVVLVTQGTVERDPEKIIVPTLKAFQGTDTLVIATTGGSRTAELRERFPDDNFIIEDFIDFREIMPHADVYVTNAGYGGVMLGIQNRLPIVAAGIHEGKSEIAARVGYFKVGVNLRTETPSPRRIRRSVEKVLGDPVYRENVLKLRAEFARYQPLELCEKYISEVLGEPLRQPVREALRARKLAA